MGKDGGGWIENASVKCQVSSLSLCRSLYQSLSLSLSLTHSITLSFSLTLFPWRVGEKFMLNYFK